MTAWINQIKFLRQTLRNCAVFSKEINILNLGLGAEKRAQGMSRREYLQL